MIKFWTPKKIDEIGALYNMVIGERGNGKTTAIMYKILENFVKRGEMGVIIRRLETQITGNRAQQLWQAINGLGWVSELTEGEYDRVVVRSSKCYLARYDEEVDRVIPSHEHFCNILALSQAEHNKSISFPDVTTILFDEFLTTNTRLKDEFDMFKSTVSTIVRHRRNAKVYLLGNTVTSRSIYFSEFGVRNVRDMKQGTIGVSTRKDKEGKDFNFLALEYCAPTEGGKESDVMFLFESDKRSMEADGIFMTGSYPRPTHDYKGKDVMATIHFTDEAEIDLTMRIIRAGRNPFLLVHQNKHNESDFRHYDATYSLIPSADRRTYMDPTRSYGNRATAIIALLIDEDRIFFATDEAGQRFTDYVNDAVMYSSINR